MVVFGREFERLVLWVDDRRGEVLHWVPSLLRKLVDVGMQEVAGQIVIRHVVEVDMGIPSYCFQ